LPSGYYRLVVAQFVVGENQQRIDLFFEQRQAPLERSAILLADEMLSPSEELVETADIAGF
jgi:hypothetical protein